MGQQAGVGREVARGPADPARQVAAEGACKKNESHNRVFFLNIFAETRFAEKSRNSIFSRNSISIQLKLDF